MASLPWTEPQNPPQPQVQTDSRGIAMVQPAPSAIPCPRLGDSELKLEEGRRGCLLPDSVAWDLV